MKHFFFLLFTFMVLSSSTQASRFEKCGVFYVEGKFGLSAKSKFLTLFLNPESESEMPIYFQETKPETIKHHMGREVKAHVQITKECQYFCFGKLVKNLGQIDPYKSPENYTYPNYKIIKEEPCLKSEAPNSKNNQK